MNRFKNMFSPIDAREAQVQPMEKHSDSGLFSSLWPCQVLSSASAVKCCLSMPYRAGSRACIWLNVFAFFFFVFFRSKKLSQPRGAEPATREW